MFKDHLKLKLSASLKDILRIPFYKFYDTLVRHDTELLKRNDVLKNKYEGQSCFLLLTGESISHIDLDLLKDEYSFGVGFLFLHPQIYNLELNFSLAAEVDEWMDILGSHGSYNWPENHIRSNGVNQGYIYLKKVFDTLHANGTTIFLNHDHIGYYRRIQLFNLNDEKIFYLRLMSHLHKKNHPVLDLTKRFIGGGGSIHDSILILIYMGFKEIFLCGAGYTYDPVYELHFYDNYLFSTSMGRAEAEHEARKAIEAHGGEAGSTLKYYGLFEKDDFYRSVCVSRNDYGLYRDKHRILNNYAQSVGVKIYNIVPDRFESPVYDKVTWQEVKDNTISTNPEWKTQN